MKSAELDKLARLHGISPTRPSPENREVAISAETKRKILSALNIELTRTGETGAPRREAKPARGKIPVSFLPDFLSDTRVWGVSLQLYELRSARNWGIGDFKDLADMADLAGSLGADFIGLNPLHAPFLADPDRCSPYEPSSRQHLNPLYIAVDQVPGFASSRELERELERLRQSDLVDYIGVARTKLGALRDLWSAWRQGRVSRKAASDGPADFDAFVAQGGDSLRLHALFECLSFYMVERGAGAGWQRWPAEFQRVDSAAVTDFEREHPDDVRFHMWLQWLAHRQLMQAADRARKAGLRIGLYLDLAVGEAVDGSATWSEPDIYVSQATIGSPPDPFAVDGQDWHLAGYLPSKIAAGEMSPYRRMVSTSMRYAGAIRIDHAPAIRRLFLVPLGDRPESGAYVRYPEDRLLQILAEVSAEHRCLVIGESLGMIPEGLQEDLAAAGIFSYRILSYEQDDKGFKPADAYPVLALACISTHDHQTLAGWWRGADIRDRCEHGIVPPDLTEEHLKHRKHERRNLKVTFKVAGIDLPARLAAARVSEETLRELTVSAYRFIARTPSLLVAVRLADLTDEKKPTNVPGTSDSYPNWKPKLSVWLEDLTTSPLPEIVGAVMREERPRE
ncbi:MULTISPECIES: 4-alpha-glucanotransferase [unclassified Rhizobium]|uniref:4-alpha-glucanotransferase n=1 Tax=unclassified Rhizobium TaxID=2613769 RepID=UPI001A980D51|nr:MULTISPECIES: 4-alpha-glucanotransferase [unclassified Rhizobium]MBX5156855.1 4-alpha-glucanotransferase [Rhizobium sp. NZLR8]MBX5168574.1 4-alpha-glucanotransferase [Rhizobium sp. NZLR1b]MBX5187840.1 4-alpha-glucanotransferase [Rhizobium sp. NZLR3b]MBX5199898.1 4-alpha-glucanotransferase [Rhizobium sp. NZLR1]QSZ23605.1 4-alpha-glucanotransferase [Rhizobium sp. NZLR1]